MESIFLALKEILAAADSQRLAELKEALRNYATLYPRTFSALKCQNFAGGVIDAIETTDILR